MTAVSESPEVVRGHRIMMKNTGPKRDRDPNSNHQDSALPNTKVP